MIPRPSTIFDREEEWSELVRFTTSRGSGMRMALVYGKRRQGKSLLLRELAARTDGLYHQALAEERAPALQSFGRDAAAVVGMPGLRPADWREALDVVLRVAAARRPFCVVIDELPYLLKHSPELPSLLQRVYDDSRIGGRREPVRLILCGSALSTMTGQQAGRAPLFGRIERVLHVKPFDPRTARAFWGIADLRLAFEVDAILGGTPAYRSVMGGPPGSRRALGEWLARGPLDPNSLLYREPDLLLAEELGASDRTLYASVMAAIGRGATGPGKVAAEIGREQGTVQLVIKTLVASGMVDRDEDALRRRRPVLRVADPLVRFHNVVVRRHVARIELGSGREVWDSVQDDVSSHIFGPHFEALARWWTWRMASQKTLGGSARLVSATVVNDAAARAQHQIDVVALSSLRDRILLIGEAKVARCGLDELARLQSAQALIPGAAGCRLALFSATGFDARLRRQADARDDVELIDLQRLYEGD
jgi:hypothetical protein